jgi:hypothetical protein
LGQLTRLGCQTHGDLLSLWLSQAFSRGGSGFHALHVGRQRYIGQFPRLCQVVGQVLQASIGKPQLRPDAASR